MPEIVCAVTIGGNEGERNKQSCNVHHVIKLTLNTVILSPCVVLDFEDGKIIGDRSERPQIHLE
jgi:hypothetical protein